MILQLCVGVFERFSGRTAVQKCVDVIAVLAPPPKAWLHVIGQAFRPLNTSFQ